jgi:mRNA interferase RelE/StbE
MYRIIFSKTAEKDLDKLPVITIKKISKAIDNLAENPRPVGCKKLKSTEDNLWRIRIGDYRVIYEITDEIKVIDIRRIRHRKDIYE